MKAQQNVSKFAETICSKSRKSHVMCIYACRGGWCVPILISPNGKCYFMMKIYITIVIWSHFCY